ncbi:MAG: response regulator transcription factor [Bacillota bacterium]
MAGKEKILIVEDERNICNFLIAVLTANNYDVIASHTGADAYTMITSHCPDLVLLDLGLPDIDGLSIVSAVRQWTQLPIIVISARSQEKDKVEALDRGADDYITKPFGTSELLARIRTAIRHTYTFASDAGVAQTGIFKAGELTIDYDKRSVLIRGEDAHLTQNEYKIMALLGKYAGKVLTYDYILKELWGPSSRGNNQILRVNMANIRRKIEENPAEPKYVFTEVGVGYRMTHGE